MAFRLIWAPSAKYDLKDIATFIEQDRPTTAERVVKSLFNALEQLTDFPESGRMVPEFGDPAIRELIRKPFRIVYRVNKEQRFVEIARVWHALRGTPDIA